VGSSQGPDDDGIPTSQLGETYRPHLFLRPVKSIHRPCPVRPPDEFRKTVVQTDAGFPPQPLGQVGRVGIAVPDVPTPIRVLDLGLQSGSVKSSFGFRVQGSVVQACLTAGTLNFER